MPIIKSAQKRMRQAERRRAQNLRAKRSLKAAAKAFEAKPTFEALRQLQSQIDTAVKKQVLSPNTGSRQMKRYSRLAKAAGVKITAAKKPAAKRPAVAKSAPTKKPATVKKPAAAKKPAATPAPKKPVAKTSSK